MTYNKPLPRLDTLNKPFWTAAKEGKLLLQHCPSCLPYIKKYRLARFPF